MNDLFRLLMGLIGIGLFALFTYKVLYEEDTDV